MGNGDEGGIGKNVGRGKEMGRKEKEEVLHS